MKGFTVLTLSTFLLKISGVNAQDALLGYWNADGNANDSSAFQNHGTGYGVSYERGISGLAFVLDTGWVDLGNSSIFNFGPYDFTVSLWVNFKSSDQQDQVLIEKFQGDGHPKANSAGFESNSTGWSVCKLNSAEGTSLGLFADGSAEEFLPPIRPGVWHQLVVTRSDNVIKYYFDGELHARYDTFTEDISASDAPLVLGRRNNDGETYIKTLLDEIKIYSIALEASDVAESYASFMQPPNISPTPSPSYDVPMMPTASPTMQPDQDVLIFKYFIIDVIEAIGELEKCRHLMCLERRSKRVFRVFRRANRKGLITREQLDIMAEIIKLATTEKKRELLNGTV